MTTVVPGGAVHTQWSFYRPPAAGATPSELLDPDEFPNGPRFELYHTADDSLVQGYDEIAYTRRNDRGVYVLDLPIPVSGDLAAGEYYLQAKRATVGGTALVGQSGTTPLRGPFTVLPPPKGEDYSTLRLYAEPGELGEFFGVSPAPQAHEVLFAQQLLDDWMHRSLWPTVYERERKNVPPDRNLVVLTYRPVIRIFQALPSAANAAQPVLGRYGYGRRDRRVLNQTSGNYLSVMAVMGNPPQFIPIDPAQIEFRPETGECWFPTGFFLVNYSQLEITYEAGYRVIPFGVKVALAETIAFVRIKGFGPLSSWSVGRVSQQTGEELMTPEVKRRLEPYRAKFFS